MSDFYDDYFVDYDLLDEIDYLYPIAKRIANRFGETMYIVEDYQGEVGIYFREDVFGDDFILERVHPDYA